MTYEFNSGYPLLNTFIVLESTVCMKKTSETAIEKSEKCVKPGDLYDGILVRKQNKYYIDLGYDRKLCYTVLIPVTVNKKSRMNVQIY